MTGKARAKWFKPQRICYPADAPNAAPTVANVLTE